MSNYQYCSCSALAIKNSNQTGNSLYTEGVALVMSLQGEFFTSQVPAAFQKSGSGIPPPEKHLDPKAWYTLL